MLESNFDNPKGILKPSQGKRKFHLSLLPPTEDLAFFVEHYWIVSWDLIDQGPYVQETLPYPSVHLVFEAHQTKIFGVMTGKFSRILEHKGRVFGIKFRPGAFYPFAKVRVSTFTNSTISCQQAFGVDISTLEDVLLTCMDEEGMRAIAERFLCERLPQRDEHITEINQVIEAIIAHPEITRVDDIARYLHLKKRTLQRLFNQYVGVSPKWVIKRYRLHEVAERLAEGEFIDGAEIASELGYFDQAHFIKDFKAVVGRTPAQYAKKDE
jgi:AraC-like DNA-binding protein